MTEATPKAKTTKAKPRAKKATAKTTAAKAAPKADPKNAFETASGIMVTLARTNFEEGVETARAVMKSGSIKSAVELQNEYVRSTLKRNIDAARELNELTVSTVREAVAPYATKFTEAFDKLRAA
ncbi:phasin family protein [Parvibaculum sp.]|uniref:phasin family protein n=1 Tax=Parvibaculum sp. TaxID=2024848 RepID=UPI001B2D9480|nr:phasin family protein [Parvibaculum sp.]MBO6667145.1 phasin family protein [Parvibaculum sp.]MBO6693069.1 phasin family protein [Parvibaculum sp.]MBO6713698.1 phasin family protein [Parvibaculum sp.]